MEKRRDEVCGCLGPRRPLLPLDSRHPETGEWLALTPERLVEPVIVQVEEAPECTGGCAHGHAAPVPSRSLVILSDTEVKAWNEAREKENPPKSGGAKATVPFGWGEV